MRTGRVVDKPGVWWFHFVVATIGLVPPAELMVETRVPAPPIVD